MTRINSDFDLVPRITTGGPALAFDFPGVAIGTAEYDEGPTGCTVIRLPRACATAIDVRGGWAGVSSPVPGSFTYAHAICLVGGSLLGLEALTGVTAELFASGERTWQTMPLVLGAVIFDYTSSERMVYPDRELGRAATQAAVEGRFPLGPRGAGRGATVGKMQREAAEPSGQGAAFREVGETKLLFCTVVNAVGAVLDRSGAVVRGNCDPGTGERRRSLDILDGRTSQAQAGQNTTLSVLVTNAKLGQHELTQLGRQVHTSMARAIDPFHTSTDGDVLYAVSTSEVEPKLHHDHLGMMASELAWDAVLAAVAPEKE